MYVCVGRSVCVYVCVLLLQYEKVGKLTADAKYEETDIKAAIAALSFILSSAAKYSVDGDSLDNELQQLGLPKGNSCGESHTLASKTVCDWRVLNIGGPIHKPTYKALYSPE